MAARRRGPFEKGCWGCLAAAVLLVLAGALTRQLLSASVRDRDRAYAATNTQFPFQPSPETRLSQDHLRAYAAVRQMILPSIKELARVTETMREEKRAKGGGFWLGVRTTMSMLMRTNVLQDAHIAALNKHRVSVDEYRWVGRRVFAALYQGAYTGSSECRDAWNLVKQGFGQGAPRTAEYRENPQSLADRLELHKVQSAPEETKLILRSLSQLLQPMDTLYQEVAFVLEGGEEVE